MDAIDHERGTASTRHVRRSKEAVAEVLDGSLDRDRQLLRVALPGAGPYPDRRVWTRLEGDRLTIRMGPATLAEYPLGYEPRT